MIESERAVAASRSDTLRERERLALPDGLAWAGGPAGLISLMHSLPHLIPRTLILDHHDSYTRNILSLFHQLGSASSSHWDLTQWQHRVVVVNVDSLTWSVLHFTCSPLSALGGPPCALRRRRARRPDLLGLALLRLTDGSDRAHRSDFTDSILPHVDCIILGPGPGTPSRDSDFSWPSRLIQQFGHRLPILGLCLGHQGLATSFAGTVSRPPSPHRHSHSPAT